MLHELFAIGELVKVLHAARLPAEHVITTGVVERITYQSSDDTPLYWISGCLTARTSRVLRHIDGVNYAA